MIKKILTSLLALTMLCVALFCTFSVVKGFADNALSLSAKSPTAHEPSVGEPAPSESVLTFTELSDYVAHLVSQSNLSAEVAALQSNDSGVIQYFSPDNLPEDFQIDTITIDEAGTSFSFSRRNASITINVEDASTLAMYNNAFSRTYNRLPASTNHVLYAYNLARAIGATAQGAPNNGEPTVNTRYVGDVFANIPSINPNAPTKVGTQTVYINSSGLTCYEYMPVGVGIGGGDVIAANSFELVSHIVNTSNSDQ